MSDENQSNEVSIEDLQKALAEKDAMLQDMQSQFNSVKAKSDELLNETKKAKARAREEAEAARLAEEERARKAGDSDYLLKSSEEKRKNLELELESLRAKVSSEKTQNEAMRIASEIADGPNAKILSRFIAERIKYTDDGIKVLDSHGQLTVSTLDELKSEFVNSGDYQSLLRGNKSSGGGAAGGGSSASGVATIKRANFDQMNASQKMEFIKNGGKVTD